MRTSNSNCTKEYKIFIEHGTYVNKENRSNDSPLHIIYKKGNVTIVVIFY